MKALYPSLDWSEVVRVVGKILEETEVTFDDMDFRSLGKYLAIHLTQEEISKNSLKSVIPNKVKPNKASIAFLDTDIDQNGDEKWDWVGKRKEPTILQKKRMVARAMEVAVLTILSNHLYQMDGKVYKQQAGGPIGLEITGVLARIVMLWWDRAFLKKIDTLGLDMLMYQRYVDDGNMACRAVKPGVRYFLVPQL